MKEMKEVKMILGKMIADGDMPPDRFIATKSLIELSQIKTILEHIRFYMIMLFFIVGVLAGFIVAS